jgi:hypothetical protein
MEERQRERKRKRGSTCLVETSVVLQTYLKTRSMIEPQHRETYEKVLVTMIEAEVREERNWI